VPLETTRSSESLLEIVAADPFPAKNARASLSAEGQEFILIPKLLDATDVLPDFVRRSSVCDKRIISGRARNV
jgi:hypothetical protein